MTPNPPADLERVIVQSPQPLQEAVAGFVEARRALSDHETRPSWFQAWKSTVDYDVFVDGSIPGDYACSPAFTMATVLPFFDFKSEVGKQARPALVPVRFVVGSSWRWHEGSLPSGISSAQAAIELFTSPQCARTGGLGADVTLIAPLGIFYVAGEGKNRVAFLAHHGVEHMPCMLAERDYPAAERLKLIFVREGPICSWVCVLDDELAVTVPYPEFTLPILRAYGVKKTGWSKDYPMLETVMNSFRLQPSVPDNWSRSGTTRRVSLSHLKSRESAIADVGNDGKPLLEHSDLVMDPRFLRRHIFAWVGLLGLSLLLRLLPVAKETATSTIALLVGIFVGAVFMLFVPIHRQPELLPRSVVASRAADGSDHS